MISVFERHRPHRSIISGLLAASLFVSGAVATAQPAELDDRTKAAARQLAQDGAAAFERGDFTEARALLRRAYALIPAPTIALMEARALAKLGKLVEAAERYEVARRTDLGPNPSDAFKAAVRDADAEVSKLRPRIPLLTIRIVGTTTKKLEVQLDGDAVPPPLVGVRQPVNPGKHGVRLLLDGRPTPSKEFELEEGEEKTVEVQVSSGAATVASDGGARDGGAQRTWGYVALGVGAAGLATGAITGALMLKKDDDLAPQCMPTCPPSAQDDLDAFRTYRTVSFIGYGVGVAGIGLGAILLLTAPDGRPPPPTARALSPVVGIGHLGVRGTF